ncbi:hypothetical protein BAE44_0025465 [Dichanthelium oligosanthes]|uniref:Uncharacterized protein n=1 Tax=Dichanthelium oligosanthes TaxID=888268 RepID=A0A1E5UL33_9POAL|nr:hypothetical protein BAE44_0025465 [Dichanthelium oligosanthes]
MAAADVDADALAADIICSLRGAELAGWTPPWCKPEPGPAQAQREGELIWPAVARGKRSRRRSPSAAAVSAAATAKGRWGRGSPASPLSGGSGSGSGSGASTSGGEDGGGGFCSTGHRRTPATKVRCSVRTRLSFSLPSLCRRHRAALGSSPSPTTTTSSLSLQVGSIGRPQLTFPTPTTRTTGQRPRKKLRLPEVQQLVWSLAVENESLCEEMRALQRACKALSKENDKLETRLEQSNSQNEIISKDQKGKQQSVMQSAQDSFALPDLNLLPQDTADVSSVH